MARIFLRAFLVIASGTQMLGCAPTERKAATISVVTISYVREESVPKENEKLVKELRDRVSAIAGVRQIASTFSSNKMSLRVTFEETKGGRTLQEVRDCASDFEAKYPELERAENTPDESVENRNPN